MAHFIVHHAGAFFEWSTVMDAPVTCAMSRAEFASYYSQEHGAKAARGLALRLDRAVLEGCDAGDGRNAEDCVCGAGNRAGEDEEELSFEEVIALIRSDESRADFDLPPLAE